MKSALLWGSTHALLSIAFGAFGAHGLKRILSPEALIWVETGARYEMYAGLALLALAALEGKRASRTWPGEVWALGLGAAIFSGSLYLMALTQWRFFGALAPVGGLLMMAAFLLVGIDAFLAKPLKTEKLKKRFKT